MFCEAGGLDIGFSDIGFDIIESVEIEQKFYRTLELNSGIGKKFENSKVNCIDIREFTGEDLGRVDFIIREPPCQTFSAAGRRANGVSMRCISCGVPWNAFFKKELRLKF